MNRRWRITYRSQGLCHERISTSVSRRTQHQGKRPAGVVRAGSCLSDTALILHPQIQSRSTLPRANDERHALATAHRRPNETTTGCLIRQRATSDTGEIARHPPNMTIAGFSSELRNLSLDSVAVSFLLHPLSPAPRRLEQGRCSGRPSNGRVLEITQGWGALADVSPFERPSRLAAALAALEQDMSTSTPTRADRRVNSDHRPHASGNPPAPRGRALPSLPTLSIDRGG